MKYDRDYLILEHLKLAEEIAVKEWRTATHALEKDEMMSLAYFGLIDAAERWEAYCVRKSFDPDAIQYFKVFARLRIRGTIRDSIRSADWATRTLRSKSKKLKDAGQDEGVAIDLLAERTGMTVSEIHKVNSRLAKKPVSLDAKIGIRDFGADTNQEIQIKEDIDTEGIAFANEMIRLFIETVKSLSVEEQVVIALHYYSKINIADIAKELQISEPEVIKLHSSGVKAVKYALTEAASEKD